MSRVSALTSKMLSSFPNTLFTNDRGVDISEVQSSSLSIHVLGTLSSTPGSFPSNDCVEMLDDDFQIEQNK